MNEKRLIILSIIGTGITSVVTQLLTIREFLTQFHGNEITISLVLFCWLFLTGIGSLAAKGIQHTSLRFYAVLILVIALWPLIQLAAIRELREIFFSHGVSPGFYPIFFYILISITPYCLLMGFILPYAQKVLNLFDTDFKSGDLYLTDSIGDITGGALFSFVLVYWFKPFATIAITSTLLVLVVFFLLFQTRSRILLFTAFAVSSVFYGYATSRHFERLTLTDQYGDIVSYLESPYGRIVITGEEGQYTFWESGSPLYSGSSIMTSEEKVHYPLCQLDKVENVLLVSGGLGETISEVNKYHPAHMDYVELDPILIEAALSLGVLNRETSLEIMNMDGRSYIQTPKRTYDAIIIDIPDPDTFQLNRFFTSEFFFLTKKILNKGGILSFSIACNPNYLSHIQKNKIATLYNTARGHFQNVRILPGCEAYFLCRDEKLWPDIPDRLAQKSISTSYIDGFFYGNVTEERIKALEYRDKDAPINEDFSPVLMRIMFHQWFIKHGTSPDSFLFSLMGLTVIYLIFIRKEEYVLFSTGLAAMGVEMLVIFAFQVAYGYIYLKIGAIVTAFLMGLLPGALIGNRLQQKRSLSLTIAEILLLFLLVLFYGWAVYFRIELQPVCYMVYCFLFSLVCGFQFPIVAGIIGEKKSPAAGCLAADLAGAAVGALVIGTIVIPLWGIQTAVIVLMVVKISSLVTVFWFRKN